MIKSNKLSLVVVIFGLLCCVPLVRALGDSIPITEVTSKIRAKAEGGDISAQCSLGEAYSFGKGVPKDDTEAAKWYRKAANQGYAMAQGNLGMMYAQGSGVTQDYAEAVKWYRKAASQNNSVGQVNLGVMYAEGQGVIKDYTQAYMWFNLAAAQNVQSAIKGRDMVEKSMTPDQIAEAQRLSSEWKPTAVRVTSNQIKSPEVVQ